MGPQGPTIPTEPDPDPEPFDLTSLESIPSLKEIIANGNALLQKQQKEFQRRWEVAAAQATGQSSEVKVDIAGFDEDIKQLFNAYAGQSSTQTIFLLVQVARSQIKTQLLVQALAAKMLDMDAAETQKAAKEIISGG